MFLAKPQSVDVLLYYLSLYNKHISGYNLPKTPSETVILTVLYIFFLRCRRCEG